LVSHRKHVGILIRYGPEVRAFVHSGLVTRLAKVYDVTILAHRPQSAAFEGLTGVPLVPLPAEREWHPLALFRSLAGRTHSAWLDRRGREKWNHYLRQSPPVGRRLRASRWLGHFGFSTRAVLVVGRASGRLFGTHPVWARILRELELDGILTTSHASPWLIAALQTAHNLGIKLFVATNSWKDIYTSPNVPVVPDVFGVWSSRAAGDVCDMNPHLPPSRVVVMGSLHLAPFLRPAGVMSREEFCATAHLDPGRPIICYTAAAPAAVVNEEGIVDFLAAAIERGELPGRPQLLVRLNPMENGERFAGVVQRHAGLVIQKPAWEWDQADDWCCALPRDVNLWVATVEHAALNVSISSTVTLEFAARGRPVVNVCFDLPEPLPADRSSRRFWDAGFYAEVREEGLATPARSGAELVAACRSALAGNGVGARPAAATAPNPVDALERALREVLAL
jgi:hypothetical protein